MTNAQIIFNARMDLMEQGKIRTTGNILTVRNDDGSTAEISEPEQIHTYAIWQKAGYQVRRGEKAVACITIWIPRKKKGMEEAEQSTEGLAIEAAPDMFLKKSYFFSASQVDRKN